MNRNLAAWAALGLLGLFAALTYWLAQAVEPPPPKRDGSTRHDPDFIVENFSAVRLGEDGKPRFTLAAVKMTHYPDTETSELVRPHFTRFSPTAAPLHALAQKGTVSRDGEEVYLRDNVRIIREAHGDRSELTLTTSALHIQPEKELAMTDQPVTITDAHTQITGVGLKLNAKTRHFQILSRVKVHYAKPRR
ncbi:MAG: LPS export ABC transporter periplasmic protein LptC [Burkholderiales bacterium]